MGRISHHLRLFVFALKVSMTDQDHQGALHHSNSIYRGSAAAH
jgi:hypothetical protein